MQLLDLAKTKTETRPARHLDLAASHLSIKPIGQDEVAQAPGVPHLLLSVWPVVVPQL